MRASPSRSRRERHHRGLRPNRRAGPGRPGRRRRLPGRGRADPHPHQAGRGRRHRKRARAHLRGRRHPRGGHRRPQPGNVRRAARHRRGGRGRGVSALRCARPLPRRAHSAYAFGRCPRPQRHGQDSGAVVHPRRALLRGVRFKRRGRHPGGYQDHRRSRAVCGDGHYRVDRPEHVRGFRRGDMRASVCASADRRGLSRYTARGR